MYRTLAIIGLLALGACNGGGAASTPAAPTPGPLHLYVGNDNAGGAILQYNLPLTSTTTSNFTIAAPGSVVSLGVDSTGTLGVGLLSGSIAVFAPPLSAASVAAATFSNGGASNNGQLAFTTTGDLFAASVANKVNGFTHPFTNASVASSNITNAGMVSDIGTTFDAAQNLYIANAGTGNAAACVGTAQPGGGCGSNIFVYAPPYTGAPIVAPNVINFPVAGNSTAYRKIAVDTTHLYAASVAGATGRVDVYTLPITAASAPAFALTTGVNTPEALAMDPSGNLYIGNLSDATVTVYSPPISAASVPSLIFTVSSGAFAIFGIAVGK